MWEFSVLILIPFAIQQYTTKKYSVDYQNRNRRALLFFFVMLTIMIALRHKSIGTDTRIYMSYFEQFSGLSWRQLRKYPMETGFVFLNKIISFFTDNPQVFLAITAIVTTAMIYPTYTRLCVDSSLTIALFVAMPTFTMMFSGIRQMLAIGMGFLAYECTRHKKIFPYILCVLCAITIHRSAVMLAFMYPLFHTRITKKWLMAVVPAFVVVFVFNEEIFSVLGGILSRFDLYEVIINRTNAFSMLILFILFSAFSFIIPEDNALDNETMGLRNFLLFSVVLQMFAPLHELAMRMNYYYILFIPLLIPRIVICKSNRWSQIAVMAREIMVAFFLAYFLIDTYMASQTDGGTLNTYPYRFFWEKGI